MKILHFKKNNVFVPGLLKDGGLIDIHGLLLSHGHLVSNETPLTCDLISTLLKLSQTVSLSTYMVHEQGVIIGPPIPKPLKIICIGLNYRRHAHESGMAVPTTPVAFTKYNNTLINYEAEIALGNEGIEFDYEVELGVYIGRKAKMVSEADALSHVLGYTVANDLSCRDLQFRSSQWLLGKSLDGFLPLGKYLVTPEEVPDSQNLRLTCSLNGDVRQDSNTSDMIFSVRQIVSYLSRFMTLEPGDLILTGTPEGVIMGRQDKLWLKPGDVVKVAIEGIGESVNLLTK